MTLVAHAGSGIVNTWGFAFVGSVLGIFTTSLFFVHRTVTLRAERGSTTAEYPFRWIILAGFVGGISIGLGTARLLDAMLEDTPTAADLVRELCTAADSGRPDAFDDVHIRLVHYTDDTGDAVVVEAHTRLDLAVARAPDQTPTSEVAGIIEALGVDPEELGVECPSAT